MIKFLYSLILALVLQASTFAQMQTVTYSVSPASFNETQSVTITVNGNSINESTWGITNNSLYIWAWSYDQTTNTSQDCPTNGTWTTSGAANKFTYNAGSDTYTLTFTPTAFFNRTGLNKMGFLVKALDGTGNKKSQDIYVNIGTLQFLTGTPAKNSVTFVNPGNNNTIDYTTNIAANWTLTANGATVATINNSTSFNYAYTVNGDANMVITATNPSDGTSILSNFTYSVTPVVQSAAIPSYMRQGITYSSDNTKVGLAIYAPMKSFIHVIGSFNNWTVSSPYLMKRDTANPDLYWIEISGLTQQQIYTFQYRTNDGIKVADPFSRLVLSPDDDPWISAATYPNLPPYPIGQKYDVSVIQTGMPNYPWTITNFTKPSKEKLVVYELLVRDFTTQQNWQSIIDKIPYIKGLGVNAVELLPVMEFEGNNSWGYNPSFHFALDKAYGTADKFKEFIDLCHQNGIAVILDIALNHATQRNPLIRLWNVDPDGDGYGAPSSSNPYFNTVAKHSYSVNEDFNHSLPTTKYYVNRVLEQWISEYKIDGFRWDLTKGFTQACSASNDACTNSYQQDRVDILKTYADYQWALDPTSYAIFEHLGTDGEEQQWASYRLSEGKGVIMWDIQNNSYNQNTMGFSSSSDFSRIDFEAHGFGERRNISYAESHDEERLMYKNKNYGNFSGPYDTRTLNNGLTRAKAQGAVLLPVPGPKMIWQFGELGYDLSINRCEDGSINNGCRTSPKPSAFSLDYDTDVNRKSVYDTWSKFLFLRNNNEVFNTSTFTVQSGNLMPRIYIWNDALPSSSLKNVVILANFTLSAQNIVPDFPYAGNWYNLMDNTSFNVSNTANPITLQAGEFRIFGNAVASTLGTHETISYNNTIGFKVMQNPASNGEMKIQYSNAKSGTIYIYDLTGNLLYNFKVKEEKGEETFRIDRLKTGLYMLQLKTPTGAVAEKMIVK